MEQISNETEIQLFDSYITRKIGVIGTGQMGTDIFMAFENYVSDLQKKHNKHLNVNSKDIFYLSDADPTKKKHFNGLGYKNFVDNEGVKPYCYTKFQVIKNSDIILISVKPDTVEPVLTQNRHLITEKKIIVSIAAGVSLETIQEYIGSSKAKIIRVMPNALCSIRESSSVYCVNSNISNEEELLVQNLFKNVGLMMKIDQKLINVFSGFSGAGPAYVYVFAEALIDGALKNGVPYNQAKEFAIQTLYGSAKLLTKRKDPYNMKYQITTPGGITIAGINALEQNNFRFTVMEAITQAKKKADDMDELKAKYLKPKF